MEKILSQLLLIWIPQPVIDMVLGHLVHRTSR